MEKKQVYVWTPGSETHFQTSEVNFGRTVKVLFYYSKIILKLFYFCHHTTERIKLKEGISARISFHSVVMETHSRLERMVL